MIVGPRKQPSLRAEATGMGGFYQGCLRVRRLGYEKISYGDHSCPDVISVRDIWQLSILLGWKAHTPYMDILTKKAGSK
jgi:hypothetical protein